MLQLHNVCCNVRSQKVEQTVNNIVVLLTIHNRDLLEDAATGLLGQAIKS